MLLTDSICVIQHLLQVLLQSKLCWWQDNSPADYGAFSEAGITPKQKVAKEMHAADTISTTSGPALCPAWQWSPIIVACKITKKVPQHAKHSANCPSPSIHSPDPGYVGGWMDRQLHAHKWHISTQRASLGRVKRGLNSPLIMGTPTALMNDFKHCLRWFSAI